MPSVLKSLTLWHLVMCLCHLVILELDPDMYSMPSTARRPLISTSYNISKHPIFNQLTRREAKNKLSLINPFEPGERKIKSRQTKTPALYQNSRPISSNVVYSYACKAEKKKKTPTSFRQPPPDRARVCMSILSLDRKLITTQWDI